MFNQLGIQLVGQNLFRTQAFNFSNSLTNVGTKIFSIYQTTDKLGI